MEDRDPFDVQSDSFQRGAGLYLEPVKGASAEECAVVAACLARRHGRKVVFAFRGMLIEAVADSNPYDLMRQLDRQRAERDAERQAALECGVRAERLACYDLAMARSRETPSHSDVARAASSSCAVVADDIAARGPMAEKHGAGR